MNYAIQAQKIRLVDENGEMVGVVARQKGLEMAAAAGLDLVEISPNAEPPVCKILDYGKFKFEAQKKKAEAKKKQKVVEIKEIKLRPGIDDNDYNVKLKSMQRFIGEGNKVKITMRFRGREMSHQEIGEEVLTRVKTDMGDIAKVEQQAKVEGRQITLVLAPK